MRFAVFEFCVASAEDTILPKLAWYQWNDVMGIARTRGRQLDSEYLRDWASRLGIPDLLARVLDAPVGK